MTKYTRRQFFCIGAIAASLPLLAAAPKPCWELNQNNPNWCPSPTPPPPSPTRSHGLLLLF